jgi:hypothetical protein
MIKGQSHGSGRQVQMHGFLLELARLLMVLTVELMSRVIYTVLFVMRLVPLKYLMCQISILCSSWINLSLEKLISLIPARGNLLKI